MRLGLMSPSFSFAIFATESRAPVYTSRSAIEHDLMHSYHGRREPWFLDPWPDLNSFHVYISLRATSRLENR